MLFPLSNPSNPSHLKHHGVFHCQWDTEKLGNQMPCSHTQICICIPKVVTGYIQSSIGNTGYITDIGWGIINGTVFRLRSQLVQSKIDWGL